MERKNWIWFCVAFLALAAFCVCIAVLRSGPKGIAPNHAAPPVLQEDSEQSAQSAESEPEPEPEPEVYASDPGALDLYSLCERFRITMARAEDREAAAYPAEEVELVEGAQRARFVRAALPTPESGEKRYYCREAMGDYLLSEADGTFRVYGGGDEPVLRSVETFTGETAPAFLISSGERFLRVEGDRFRVSDARLATRWAEEPDTGLWYTVIGGRKRYLNSDGLGDRGQTRWRLDGDVLRGSDANGSYALYCDGDWMLTTEGAIFLTDGRGHCFNIDETGVLPDTGQKTRWSYDNDAGGPGGYFRTFLNGHSYTLSVDHGQLYLSTERFTDYWVYMNGTLFINKDGATYCLNYRAGAWRAEPMTGWRITDGERYLSAANGAVVAETDADDASVWRIEDAGAGVVISTGESEPLYLGYEESVLTLSPHRRTLWQRDDDSLRAESGALGFRVGWSLGEGSELRFEPVNLPMLVLKEADAADTSKVELPDAGTLQLVERSEAPEGPVGAAGCVAISAGSDNPGYICAGDAPVRLAALDGADAAEVRIRTAPDGAPRSAGDGEFGRILPRFQKSAEPDGVWALRLSGEVRADDLSVLPLARLGGELLADCELPRNAVDLRLAAQGTVSLLAADCPADNFTLYSVERDPESGRVTDIREISRIFRGADRLVYDYAEGGLPVREEAELVFDTAWLREPIGKTEIIGFEIPLNAGEYALGGSGGAIVYLSVSEQALKSAPGADSAEPWEVLTDRSLLSFLRDPANAVALGELLRSDASGPLVDRTGRIADTEQRNQAAELLDDLRAGPRQRDWSTLPDAGFVQWLCDPANRTRIQAMPEDERDQLAARVETLVSHADYFRALEWLNALPSAG